MPRGAARRGAGGGGAEEHASELRQAGGLSNLFPAGPGYKVARDL